MPDLQPTLTGATVVLRPLRPDDWEEMFAAASDPSIWAGHPVRDRYREEVFRGYFDGAIASRSAFAILDRSSGAIVGSSRYNGLDVAGREIEIGWTFLIRACWGGATNREVKRLMLAHAFAFVDTVVFWVGEDNSRSRRAMEKIGGVLRPGIVSRPQTAGNHVVFEIAKTQFRLGDAPA